MSRTRIDGRSDAYIFPRNRLEKYMRFCDLEQKEVINVTDCKCLGNVRDLDLDEEDGCIKALIVPGPAKFLGCVGREFELFIPWCKIIRIGPDIILVDIDEKEARHKIV